MTKNILNFNQLMSYLLLLVPLALLTGPALPDILISLIALIFLIKSIKMKISEYYFTIFFYFILTLNIYLLINSIFSENILFSFRTSAVYFRFGIFAIATWYLLNQLPNLKKQFTYSLLIAFVLALLNGYYQYFFQETIFGDALPKTALANRLTLIFSDETILGNYLARMLPLLLGLIILNFKKNYIYYIVIASLLILTDILVYISTERTALGLVFISTIFVLLMLKNLKLLRLFSIVISVIGIIIISYISTDIKTRNYDFTLKQLGLTQNSEKLILLSPQHEALFLNSINYFKERPIIGNGVNSYRHICDWEKHIETNLGCSTHPHNIYFQAIAEIGIVGILFLLIPVSYLTLLVLRHIKSIVFGKSRYLTDFQVCLIACFIVSLWPILPTLNLFNNWNNIIYYLPIGFYLHTITFEFNQKLKQNEEN
jgi:O-antigen ligase